MRLGDRSAWLQIPSPETAVEALGDIWVTAAPSVSQYGCLWLAHAVRYSSTVKAFPSLGLS